MLRDDPTPSLTYGRGRASPARSLRQRYVAKGERRSEMKSHSNPPITSAHLIQTSKLRRRVGDVLMSMQGLPNADAIIHKTLQGATTFDARRFEDMLEFLELVVLNERLIVVGGPGFDLSSDAREWKGSLDERYFQKFGLRGQLDLEAQLITHLVESGIISFVTLDGLPEETNPNSLIERAVHWSQGLTAEWARFCEMFLRCGASQPHAEELAFWKAYDLIGQTLQVRFAAGHCRLPYRLAFWEEERLRPVGKTELAVQHGVVAQLKAALDSGSRELRDRLSAAGGSTVFPSTPISWEIVSNTDEPNGLVAATLQLRSEYARFRKYCAELESQLLDDSISLKRKAKLLSKIGEMRKELWPKPLDGFRKHAIETADVLGMTLEAGIDPSAGGIGSAVAAILRAPVDLVLRSMRRKRVKILMRSQKQFMAAKMWTDRLATLFGLSKDVVRSSVQKHTASDLVEPEMDL